jgi:transcriptional regulator of arginine metabolism
MNYNSQCYGFLYNDIPIGWDDLRFYIEFLFIAEGIMAINETLQARKEAIKELIKKHPVENQDMLVDLLKKEYAIETNQSVVSRDLRELGVTKHKLKDTMVYELKETDVTKEILRLGVLDVVHNESMIVVKTLAGLAPFVGDFLDAQTDIGVLATLAGENVVFVTPQSAKNITKTFEAVCQALYFKKL